MTRRPAFTPPSEHVNPRPPRLEATPSEAQSKRRKFEAKLIVATSTTWQGEIYLSRNGTARYQFRTFEQFCGALRMITGWDDQVPRRDVQQSPAPPTAVGSAVAAGRRPRTSGAGAGSSSASTGIKFVIVADGTWHGTTYRTNGGAKFSFDSFDQLMAATRKLTGWRNVKAGRANRLIAQGKIHPTLSRTYSLEDVGQASLDVHHNKHQGKVGVLCLSPEEGLGVLDEEKRAAHIDKINLFRGI